MMNDEIVGLEDCDTRIVNAFLKTRDIQRDLAPLIDNGDGTTSAERIEEVMAALLLFTRNWDIEIKEELFQHVQQYMDIILEMGA